jgi:hypothetical protein
VKPLIEQDIFSPIRETLQGFANDAVRANLPILLISEPTLKGSLSLAPIEAALLDAGLAYKRRFTHSAPDYEPYIQIVGSGEIQKTQLSGISISTIIVDGLRGRFGDPRKGPLTTVAQAHALALEINPMSPRLRRMRPWILSGNWINEALDTTYDPVFSFLRDYLSAEGSIRVIPMTEVPILDFNNYFWLERLEIEEASKEWVASELEIREIIMRRLVSPILHSKLPSTARAEELLWHCVLGSGWESDLASQISLALSNWECISSTEAASIVTDSLVSSGVV